MLTTDQSVPFHMKLSPLQDSGFVHVLLCAFFKRGSDIVLTTDKSVAFHMKRPSLHSLETVVFLKKNNTYLLQVPKMYQRDKRNVLRSHPQRRESPYLHLHAGEGGQRHRRLT